MRATDHLPAGLAGRAENRLPFAAKQLVVVEAHRPDDRLTQRRHASLLQPRELHEQLDQPVAIGSNAHGMQAVGNHGVGNLVERGVQHFKKFSEIGHRLFAGVPGVLVEIGGNNCVPDHGAQDVELAGIAAARFAVAPQVAVEHGHLFVEIGIGENRRHVVDDAAVRPPLCLRSLARIVDDVGVDVRQIHDRQIGVTLCRQAERLARQPFERTVRADVHHGVCPEDVPDPAVMGKVVVRRRNIGIMQHLVLTLDASP